MKVAPKILQNFSLRTFLPQDGDPDFGETVCDAVTNATSEGGPILGRRADEGAHLGLDDRGPVDDFAHLLG